jgi:uncharacterized protein with HEPN domain
LKKKDRSELYLKDLLDSMDQVMAYLEGMTFDEFEKDKMRIDAVLRNIQIIGEAARNISEEIKENYPDIPWRRMIGLRNIVVHAYFGVDLEMIWRISTVNIPQTQPQLEKVVEFFKEINEEEEPKDQ